MDIKHIIGKGFFIFGDNDKILAEMTYTKKDNILSFSHTFVDSSLRGQGVAGDLLKEAVKYTRENNFKILPVCSYVVAKFETGEFDDIKA